MDLISIIIPIYKVEDYLRKCLDSVIAQSYGNLEIICVDDGSPDQSGKVVQSYHDPRIRYFRKNNGGLSDARNYGIEKSSGKYLFFLDSDDFIYPNCIELLYNSIKEDNADVAVGDYVPVDESGNIIDDRKEHRLISFSGTGSETYRKFWNYTTMNTAWAKLYSRQYWGNRKFPFGKLNEDEFVIYKSIYEASKVTVIGNPVYAYVTRANSIMNTRFDNRRFAALEAFSERVHYMDERQEKELSDHAKLLSLSWIAQYIYADNDKSFQQKMKALFNEYYHRYNDALTVKNKIYLRLIVFHPSIYQQLVSARRRFH